MSPMMNAVVHRGTIANGAIIHEHEGADEAAVEVVQEAVKDEYEVKAPQQLHSSEGEPVAVASVVPFLGAFLGLDSLLQ